MYSCVCVCLKKFFSIKKTRSVKGCSESFCNESVLVLLDVVEDEVECVGLLTVVSDGDGGAASDLACDAGLVVLALTEPLAELSSLLDLEQGDVVGLAEGGDQLLVLGVFAVLGQHAQERLLAVECLANLVQSFHQTYLSMIMNDMFCNKKSCIRKILAFKNCFKSKTQGKKQYPLS